MPKISFVIPMYNHWDLTHQLLFDIYKNSPQVDEILIVNDGSTENIVSDGLEWWMTFWKTPIRELQMTKNVGFLRAANAGLKEAVGDIIALISNDVRIYKNILPEIIQKLEGSKCFLGGKLLTHDTGWNTFDGKTFPYLDGSILIAKKEDWEKIGYFDLQYAPYDMEDIDISTTARSLGYELVALDSEMTLHMGAQTNQYGTARQRQTEINREKFRKKWVDKSD